MPSRYGVVTFNSVVDACGAGACARYLVIDMLPPIRYKVYLIRAALVNLLEPMCWIWELASQRSDEAIEN
jgi:hypothetical protein